MSKILICTATLGLMVVAAAAQPARDGPPPDQVVTITVPVVIALPSTAYAMASREFELLRGRYVLSDGKTMTVSGRPRHMTAQIDGLPAAHLVAASPSLLVGRQRQIRLAFDQADNGVVREVTVTYLMPAEVRGSRAPR
jgi:hypothetical protein